VEKLAGFIHRSRDLSTDSVDKFRALWTILRGGGGFRARGLWINLWIRGVKSVDKPVDRFVENFGLWITRGLSTIHPQVIASYPQFRPQPRSRSIGLGMAFFAACPHIHRPYYYYYSNNNKVYINNKVRKEVA
jgi:hypothetical protein